MIKREDGRETRRRLLKAALDIFSEKRVSPDHSDPDLQKAGANRAAVNYYFGGKAQLYVESWQYAVERFGEYLFLDQDSTPAQAQLKHYIHTLMQNFMDKGEKGHFSRLYMMELVNPTGLIKTAWYDLIQPRRQKLHSIICRIMGRVPDHEVVVFCELSIASQCRSLLTINPDDMEYFLNQPVDQDLINRMAEHITEFTLAGIRAVGRVGRQDVKTDQTRV